MPIGKCRLCLTAGVELLDSHFMPAALYKIVRDDRFKVVHPVHVTRDVTMHSPRQVSGYLLCAGCERRFEQGGETWVIPRCWQNTTTFPLRDSLVAAMPLPATDAGVAIYEGAGIPNIDVDKLAYFAVSVFWRAAAREWSLHQQTIPRLKLASYEEELRLYLLGASFPTGAVIVILVGHGMEEMRNAGITFPHPSGRDKGWRRYACRVPGITFWLFLGRAIPHEIQRLCCVRSPQRFLFSSDEVDKANTQRQVAAFASSRAVGAHARRPPAEVGIPSPWSLAETMKLVPRGSSRVRVLRDRPKS